MPTSAAGGGISNAELSSRPGTVTASISFARLLKTPRLSILDLAGASQATVSFLTNYGHRLYSDDFVHQLDASFGEGDFYENQNNPLKVDQFLE